MSAHEWTRARQRSVRREAAPPPGRGESPAAIPVEPEPAVADEPPDQFAPGALTETAPLVSGPEVEALAAAEIPASALEDAGLASVTPAAAGPILADENSVTLEVPLAAPPSPAPERRPPTRRRAPRPTARQVELPLGLDPVSEAVARRSATETREELIERLLDPHLTLQETAKVLDVCPTTVRRYTNRGLLAHYRTPGNQRRFRLSDVLAFMERQGIPAQGLERQRTKLWNGTEAGNALQD